jgi:para-nitrobenzyl esterase
LLASWYILKDEKGIILVTLNYRLGQFGFIAHPELTLADPENPTNFGLLDQIVALTWVKKYISFFGGNFEDITVFGMIII